MITHEQIIDAINVLKPGAKWTMTGTKYVDLDWQDSKQTKPTEQEIDIGQRAEYKVIVTDNTIGEVAIGDPTVPCLVSSGCINVNYLIYDISVSNLPFYKDYPIQIKIPRGGSEIFYLVVSPYEVEILDKPQAITQNAAAAITGNAVAETHRFSHQTKNQDERAGGRFEKGSF